MGTSTKTNIKNLLADTGVSVVINGKYYSVVDLPATTSLNTFIREYAEIKGTKFMCLEGGCGACIVSATIPDSTTGKDTTVAVNSCLVPIYLCHGWAITTVEHLGNRYDGYGQVQSRLAGNNGTQCGYCSPGMVMNMYSLMENQKSEGKPALTMVEIENSFGGNLCRCTGYRPILDAFKSLASDAPKSLVKKCTDIEDLLERCTNTCMNYKNSCCALRDYRSEFIELDCAAKLLKIKLEGGESWYHVSTKKEIFEILDGVTDNSYMIVHGNTAQGVYQPTQTPTVFIDVTRVPELHYRGIVDNSLKLGANITLTDTKDYFYKVAQTNGDFFSYAKQLADHIDQVANVPVRNMGSMAGNLSIKNQHKEFPSDIFLILESVGAQLRIDDSTGQTNVISLLEYLVTDMFKKVITEIILPPWNSSAYTYKSYKITPRAQNAHAYVNAAFLFKVDKTKKCTVLERPRIVFGGIHPDFVHATKTEDMIVGKQLLNQTDLNKILEVLASEINPDYVLPDASPEYRKGLAISLFYKFVLSLSPNELQPRLKSGGELLERPLSSGQQDYQTDEALWPLTKPIQKLEGLLQCSGEAEYINDIPNISGELFGAVILSTMATASSFTIDPSTALNIPGVVAFYSAKNIPGQNNFMTQNQYPFLPDPVFADQKILYAGQALGVIVAKTEDIARMAAKKVKVEYSGTAKPAINFLDVIKSGDPTKVIEATKIQPSQKKSDVKYKVVGKYLIKGQYHFTMETQTCYCVPIEDGMDVFSSTQWPTFIQETISAVLTMPQNRINVSVRRVGGAYGCKISRSNQIAAICALAAHLTRSPVHLTLTIEENMQMIGKRFPCHTEYEVGVNECGVIQYMNAKLYQDAGLVPNELDIPATFRSFGNIYDLSTWSVTGYIVLTENPSNTWCRAPNSTEGLATIECIMEHIAKVVHKDPVSVKLANINLAENQVIPKMFIDIKQSSEFAKRSANIESFNQANRWKKRGIALLPMNYPLIYAVQYHALVSIYGNDGSVTITHGGVEIGQGVNTKIAQVCAYMFKIPVDYVTVKPTVSITSANDSTTGGSMTSETVAFAVQEACKILLERLEPVRAKLPQAEWKELIKQAYKDLVDMTSTYMFKPEKPVENYIIYGVAATEVEIDVLTGQHQIIRVDLLEDAGQSMNPYIDIGQLEGAFVMGLGYYTTEELIYDKDTGKLLTDRTWNYKVPGAKDIPIDFRIKLLKNSYNPTGVLGSKATGEPPLNLSVSVTFALRNAIASARKDSGAKEDWFYFDNPLSCERVWLYGLTNLNQYKV